MTKHTLKVAPRKTVGRKVKALRRQGEVPGNIFGRNVKSFSVQVLAKDLQKTYASVGESTLVYLQIEGEKEERPVMIREIAVHPVSSLPLHVQFQQVDLKQKVTAEVKVHIVGEAPAVKDGQGILVQQLETIEVEGLPADMPERLGVDVSSLTEVDMAIQVKDVKIGSKLELKTDPETIVVKIDPLAKKEVVEAPPAAPAEGEAAPVTEGEPTTEAAPAETKEEEKE